MVITSTISDEQWGIVKAKVNQLYRIDGLTLKKTIAALRADGFRISERICKAKIREWGFQKHSSDRELLHLLRKDVEYSQAGKVASFRVRSKSINAHAARTHFERKGILIDSASLIRMPMSPTPSLLSITSVHSKSDSHVEKTRVPSYSSKVIEQSIETWLAQSVEQVAQQNSLDAHRLVPPSQYRITEYFFHGTEALCSMSIESLEKGQTKNASINSLTGICNAVNMAADSLTKGETLAAVQHYEKSQSLFAEMLSNSNPWLLAAAFHFCILFTAMEPASPAIVSFMGFMKSICATAAPQHPYAAMMNVALRGHADRQTLQMMLHRVSDSLTRSSARFHDLPYCIVKYRTSQLEHLGFYHNAVKTLREDLSWVSTHFGKTSIQNLSRLFQLAGCLYRTGNINAAISEIDSMIELLSASLLSLDGTYSFEERISLCPLPDAYKRPLQECCKSQARACAASVRCWLTHSDHAVTPRAPYAYALLEWLLKQGIEELC